MFEVTTPAINISELHIMITIESEPKMLLRWEVI